MRHCDDETLAAFALGEPVDTADAAHVESCAVCRAEVAELRSVLGRVADAADVELVAPPERVWDAIASAVDGPDAAGGAPTLTRTEPRSGGAAPADDLAARRRGANPWLVGIAAAAAGVVIGVVGVNAYVAGSSGGDVLVASAQLADLATDADAGQARVERRPDGTEVLVVDTTVTDAGSDNLEVWLIDTDVTGMVSLGFITEDHSEFDIPAGYDVAAFPIVDISVEPADGDPTHSGDSITRGILGAADAG